MATLPNWFVRNPWPHAAPVAASEASPQVSRPWFVAATAPVARRGWRGHHFAGNQPAALRAWLADRGPCHVGKAGFAGAIVATIVFVLKVLGFKQTENPTSLGWIDRGELCGIPDEL